MLRLVTTVLILSLLAGGVEAATDFGGFAQGGDVPAHETHGDFHDDDPGVPARGGDDSRHFCHCTAHGPALIMSISVPTVACVETAASTAGALSHSQAVAPPRRPPKR
jgi:enoyl-CoA hydratase/carnithine racemase